MSVVATAGSVENIARLVGENGRCIPVFRLRAGRSAGSCRRRLADPGAARRNRSRSCSSLDEGARSIRSTTSKARRSGIGPDGSGTAYLMRQLLENSDLKGLDLRPSNSRSRSSGGTGSRRSTRSRRVRHERNAELIRTLVEQIRPRDRRSRRHRRPGGARQMAAPRQNPRRVLRHRQTDPCDRQARRAGRHAHHDERVRAPRGASGLPDAAQRGVPEFRSRQPAALGEVSGSGAVGRRGAPVLRQRRARTGGPIFPLAREPDVARLLDLSGDGRHDPFQCVERLQPLQALAHRRQPGNAGVPAQGAHRSRCSRQNRSRRFRPRRSSRRRRTERRPKTSSRTSRRFAFAVRSSCSSFVTPMGSEMYYRYQELLIEDALATLSDLLRRSGGGKAF